MDRGTLKIVARNRLSEIRRVNQSFGRFAESHGVAPALWPRVELVLDELLSNIIAYAFQDEDEHAIEIEFAIADRRLVIRLSDDGIPFDPFARPPPDTSLPLAQRELGGLGIFLAKSVMDEVSYERRLERNVVRLSVSIAPPDEEQASA